jgi:hypothetical protein
MDASMIEQVTLSLWPLMAAGAIQHVGELGADQALEQAGSLWNRVRESRKERGLDEAPASSDELREDLTQLALKDSEVASAMQMVHSHFYGSVDARHANFGISNH